MMNNNALYFPDEDYFASFIHSLNENLEGEFTLFNVGSFSKHPGGLILTGVNTEQSTYIELKPVQIDDIVDSSKATYQSRKIIEFQDQQGSHAATVIGEVKKFFILDLVVLQEVEQDPALSCAYFWIKDPLLLKQLITQSIRLGNDRIQFAEFQSESKKTHIVKIENISYFLIQNMLEDNSSCVDVYYPVMDDLFIAWGYIHPLEDIWKKSKKPRSHWTFIDHHNQTHKVVPIQWTDIYELLNFDLEISNSQLSTLKTVELDPFRIPLQLVTTSGDAGSSMWLIQKNYLSKFEALLAILDEDDLAPYVINISEDEYGEKLIFIREKTRAKNKLFIDFSVQSFANYQGFQNLYLPTQLELQPTVRRDTYRILFDLKPGINTVVLGGESTRIVKISDSGFYPLSRYIHYTIDQSLETLQPVVEGSYFNLSVYTNLAKAGFSVEKPLSPNSLVNMKKEDGTEVSTVQESAPSNPGIIDRLFGKKKEEKSVIEPIVDSKKQFEIEAERNVIADPSLQNWQEIFRVKQSLHKDYDLESCVVGLIWMLNPGDAQDCFTLWYKLVSQVNKDGGGKASEVENAKELVLSIDQVAEENLSLWLHSSINALKSIDSQLKIKEKWLLWHIVLYKNRDTREQARLQEKIRNTISEGMVATDEIPEFIRSRIFADRLLDTSNNNYDFSVATDNLALLSDAVEKFKVRSIKMSGAAIIVRIYCREMSMNSFSIKLLLRLLGDNRTDSIKSVDIMELVRRFVEDCPGSIRGWVGLYFLHSFPNTKEISKYYRRLIAKYDYRKKKKMDSVNEFLKQREEAVNPLALLSMKNRNRYYPKGNRHEKGELAEAAAKLRKVSLTADKVKIKSVLLSVLNNIESIDNDIQLARLIGELTHLINLIKMDEDSEIVLECFRVFTNRAASHAAGDIGLYEVLRHSNLAEGLIEINHKKKAGIRIASALAQLEKIEVELDFIDACSSIISTIECFELNERTELIKSLLDIIGHYLAAVLRTDTNLQEDWNRIIDQVAEACISKDKLSMNLFNSYQQQDEFAILNRILNERIN